MTGSLKGPLRERRCSYIQKGPLMDRGSVGKERDLLRIRRSEGNVTSISPTLSGPSELAGVLGLSFHSPRASYSHTGPDPQPSHLPPPADAFSSYTGPEPKYPPPTKAFSGCKGPGPRPPFRVFSSHECTRSEPAPSPLPPPARALPAFLFVWFFISVVILFCFAVFVSLFLIIYKFF